MEYRIFRFASTILRDRRSTSHDPPSKKGYTGSQEGAQWQSGPSGKRTHHPRTDTNREPRPSDSKVVRTMQEGVQRESRRGTMGLKTPEKADAPSKQGYKGRQEAAQWESRLSRRRTHHPRTGCKGSQDPREAGHIIQEGVQRESRHSRRRTHHPRRDTKGVKKGHNGSQDIREGGHTIQEGIQRESRRGTMGVKTPLLDSLCIPSWMVCPPSRMS